MIDHIVIDIFPSTRTADPPAVHEQPGQPGPPHFAIAELRVLDNSAEADPATGTRPEPQPILDLKAGRLLHLCPLADVPTWAKPIVQAALRAVE